MAKQQNFKKPGLPNQSLLQKITQFFTNFFRSRNTRHLDIDDSNDKDEEGSGSVGTTTASGTGFIDAKDPQANRADQQHHSVKEPETVLYNELKKNPAQMHALRNLINGQIPSSEAAEQFEKIRNSDIALEKIANSPLASPEIKSKAQAELQRRRLRPDDEIRKPQPPRPNPF